ncbi:hypothetical protein [Actinokineospora cianjurensis]|uniref:Uncharacterized protein n=1 Tax=Actinokineospora cianjurensis TaxID=585224 RepID=A0A421B1B9_9PSEU|nr:hypothetical protein [Actinokineospora cianjurensis]RLK58157.1 hypothetical protein CLV68_4251 [Actinokineospora cianjurensis]
MTPKPKAPRGGGPGNRRPHHGPGGLDAGTSVSKAHTAIETEINAGRPAAAPSTPNPVAGPAGKMRLKGPVDRHHLDKISPNAPAKERNTVILPQVRAAVRADQVEIQAGHARWESGLYTTASGRRYGVESNGTLYPVDGPGFVQLDRAEYKALQAIVKHNGDVDAAMRGVSRDPGIPPRAFEKATEVFRHRGK